jgi:hypothetical protein
VAHQHVAGVGVVGNGTESAVLRRHRALAAQHEPRGGHDGDASLGERPAAHPWSVLELGTLEPGQRFALCRRQVGQANHRSSSG